jgi:hypothetical protein
MSVTVDLSIDGGLLSSRLISISLCTSASVKADAEELTLTRQLRDEIAELEVDAVEPRRRPDTEGAVC